MAEAGAIADAAATMAAEATATAAVAGLLAAMARVARAVHKRHRLGSGTMCIANRLRWQHTCECDPNAGSGGQCAEDRV